MTAVGVIPVRYASSRFPGKALAAVAGRPMLERVYAGTCRAKELREVLVATDDVRIEDACRAFGARAVRTRDDHPSGTDRVAEAVRGLADDVVVNIQGDEPLIEGFVIDAAVEALRAAPEAVMSSVVHPLEPEALEDPNRVKVWLDRGGDALRFSRRPEPAPPGAASGPWQHVGLYAFRREFLLEFVALPPSAAERREGLEQLRALDNGHRIRCTVVEGWQSNSVDVPEDVARVEARLAERGRP